MNYSLKRLRYAVALIFSMLSVSYSQSHSNLGWFPLCFESQNSNSALNNAFYASSPFAEFRVEARHMDIFQSDSRGKIVNSRMEFVGSSIFATISGESLLKGKANYIIGNQSEKWKTGVDLYSSVKVQNVYNGISTVYYGNGSHLEFDFNISAGADPRLILMKWDGARQTSVNSNGEWVVTLDGGTLIQHTPVAYQWDHGQRHEVLCCYRQVDKSTAGLNVGKYDPALPLIIDPILDFSSYFGGDSMDTARAVALDTNGNIYVAGSTLSRKGDAGTPFATDHAYQTNFQGGIVQGDAFVAKFDPSGSNLIYCTYIGGRGADMAQAIAIDDAGNAYLTGATWSPDFPTQNPLFNYKPGLYPGYYGLAFITELNAGGSNLVYSTYLSSYLADCGNAIAVDKDRHAYVAGYTTYTGFPVTGNAFQTNPGCPPYFNVNHNGFVAEISNEGTNLNYSSYLGGTNYDHVTGIALDTNGCIYVSGFTGSTNFPILRPTPNGSKLNAGNVGNPAFDAFVCKFEPHFSNLVYSTFLGGKGQDQALGITVDRSGNAFVVGSTASSDFPKTNVLHPLSDFVSRNQSGTALVTNAFLSKISWNGTNALLSFSTVFGGDRNEWATGVAVDTLGDVFVSGTTTSTNFPTTGANLFGALSTTNSGMADVFITAFTIYGTCNGLLYSAYLGGSDNDFGNGIACDSIGNLYIVGQTYSTNFPVFKARQHSMNGSCDAFMLKILPPATSLPQLTLENLSHSLNLSWPSIGQATYPYLAVQSATNLLFAQGIGSTALTQWITEAWPTNQSGGRFNLPVFPNRAAQFFRLHIAEESKAPNASTNTPDSRCPCNLDSTPISLSQPVPPVIVIQPAATTVTQGNDAVLFAAANGTAPLSYQWKFNGTNLMREATNATLVLTNVQTSQAGTYSVLVTNLAGSVTSLIAVLAVNVPPFVTVQPTSETVVQGSNVTLTVEAIGTTPLFYQWFFNGTNAVADGTHPVLSLPNVQVSQSGAYQVVVTNMAGRATSSNAILTVKVTPLILTQPTNLTVLQGSNAVFRVTANGTSPLGYQWWAGSNVLAGATNSILTLTNVNESQSGSYYAVVTNSVGLVASSNAVLTVLVPPLITSQPVSLTVVQGSNAVFSVSASGTAPLAYQWWNGSNVLSGATNSSLSLTNVSVSQAGAYFVVVTNTVGMVASSNAVLTVLVPPLITSQPVSLTVVQGSNAVFSVSASGTAPLAYQWYFNSNVLGSVTTPGLVLSNVTPGQAGVYYVVITNSAGSVTSSNATLTVLSPPDAEIVLPTNNSLAIYNSLFNLEAWAVDRTGIITNVQFWAGGNLLGVATQVGGSSNYVYSWQVVNLPLGSNYLTAVAVDNNNLVATSSPVLINIQMPMSVGIVQPASNSVFVAPAVLPISASVVSNFNSVQLVEFYANGAKIGQDAIDLANPHAFTWAGVPVGSYTLTAKATDALGNVAVSPGLPVQVVSPIIVNAGPNQVVVLTNSFATASLSGIFTGGGGHITTLWTQATGQSPVGFVNAGQPNATAIFTNRVGNYILQFTAGDGYSQSSGTIMITVISNQPPMVSAGPNQIIAPSNTVVLNGTVTDDGLPAPSSLTNWWTVLSEPANAPAVGFSNPSQAITTATNFLKQGVYTLCLWASDGLVISSNTMSVTVADPSSRTYTFDADFNEGEMVNINFSDVPDQLQLNRTITPFPFVWVACSDRVTIVRIDANTGQILGEYRTVPYTLNASPSRTTVDKYGNVWVGNRCDDWNGQGSLTRVGVVIGGTRGYKTNDLGGTNFTFVADPNGEYLQPPFKYCTAVDRDGDGLIHTSKGLGDILAWDASGSHSNDGGGVSKADDECVINYTRVPTTGVRTVAVDANNDVWVGGQNGNCPDGNQVHCKVNGITGEYITNTAFTAVGGGYGGLIDGAGVLWSSRPLIRFDINKRFDMTANPPTILNQNYIGDGIDIGELNYGISIDPQTGYIWYTDIGVSVGCIDPNSLKVSHYSYSGMTGTRGLCVDNSGNVWEANSGGTTISHLKTDGTFVGNIDIGCGNSAPMGMAVDSNGKIWSATGSGVAVRIDPTRGPRMLNDELNASGSTLGEVDMVVNLDKPGLARANPYNYSDMTGFVSLGATQPTGIWRVVHDSGVNAQQWGVLQWNSLEPAGTAIKVEIRAADNYSQLSVPTNFFFQVTNGMPFNNAAGRYMEIRATFTHKSGTNASPILYDLTVSSGTNTVVASAANFAKSDRATMLENGQPIVINVLANDNVPSGASLTITKVSAASSGYVTIGAGATNLIYTPNTNFYGVDQFSYTASDGRGGLGRAVVTVEVGHVQPVVDAKYGPPIAANTNFSFLGNSLKNTVDVIGLCSDTNNLADPSVHIYTFTQPAHGFVQQNSCELLYTPNPGYFGPDSFTYTIRDSIGLSATATIGIYVSGQPTQSISCGQTVGGFLTSSNGSLSTHNNGNPFLLANTFTFVGVPGQMVNIAFNGPNLGVQAFDPNGQNINFPVSVQNNGTYMIEVVADSRNLQYASSSNYSLSMTCADASIPMMAIYLGTNGQVSNGGSIDFGVNQVGAPVQANLTITNYGSAPLTIYGEPYTAIAGNNFVLSNSVFANYWQSVVIPPAGSTNLTIWYQATQPGQTNAVLNIYNNGLNSGNFNNFTVKLLGRANAVNTLPPVVGIASPVSNTVYVGSQVWNGGIAVSATATPAPGVDISRVDFYAQSTNDNLPLGQAFGVDANGNYTIQKPKGLLPGNYLITAVATDSSGLQTVSAPVPINVLLRDASFSDMQVLLQGTNFLPNGTTINFGQVGANQPFVALFTVTNSGTGLLTGGIASVSGAPFSITNNTAQGFSLAPGASTNVPVLILANSIGKYDADLFLDSNDEGLYGPYNLFSNNGAASYQQAGRLWLHLTVFATNSQVPPTVSIPSPAPNTVYYTPTFVTLQALAAANSGVSLANVQFFAAGTNGTFNLGAGTFDGQFYNLNWQRPPLGQYMLFAQAADQSGAATISSQIPIQIMARPPISPVLRALMDTNLLNNNSTIYYAPTVAGTVAMTTLTLINSGNASLNISNITVSGGNFRLDTVPGLPISLMPGQSTNLAVDYQPSAAVNYSSMPWYWYGNIQDDVGTITINNSDVAQNPLSINLDGRGNPSSMPPSVVITNPAPNAVYGGASAISITCTASATTGASISSVYFYATDANGSSVFSSLGAANVGSNAYRANWAAPLPGNYWITAVAIDSYGLEAVSTPVPVTVQVRGTNSPQMQILAGTNIVANGSMLNLGVFSANAPVAVTLTVTNLGNTPLTNTFLQVNNGWSFTNSPQAGFVVWPQDSTNLTLEINPATNGIYSAQFVFNGNDAGQSYTNQSGAFVASLTAAVNGLQTPPLVSIVTPVDGAVIYPLAPIALKATASATSGGTLNQVEFFGTTSNGTFDLGTGSFDGTNYNLSWAPPTNGQYQLIAEAYDSMGMADVSATSTITVQSRPPISPVLVVSTGTNALGNNATVYFPPTTQGSVSGLPVTLSNTGNVDLQISNITVSTYIDSGLYWGQPGDPNNYWYGAYGTDIKLASSVQPFTIHAGQSTNITVQFQPSNYSYYGWEFGFGANQNETGILTVTSGDSARNPLNLYFSGYSNPNTTPPTISITNPLAHAVFNSWPTVTMVCTSTPSAGAGIAMVNFYAVDEHGVPYFGPVSASGIGGNAYAANWANWAPGNYVLTAVSVDSAGLQSLSAPVPITIQLRDTNAPVMQILWGTNILANGSSLNFGLMPTNAWGILTLTITNLGNTPLTNNFITLNSSWFFTNSPQNGFVVPVNASTNLTLAMNSGNVGNYTGQFVFGGNDYGQFINNQAGVFSINLSATTTNSATPPSVVLVNPQTNGVLLASNVVSLTAFAVPGVGRTISQVNFYTASTVGNVYIGSGSLTGSNYVYNWTAASPGSYSLTAVAVDNFGLASVSAPVPVVVSSPAMAVFVNQTNLIYNHTTIGGVITPVGTPVSTSITISNTGTATLSVAKLLCSNTNDYNLSYGFDFPLLIAPGASQNLTLNYNAARPGMATAVLTIYNNDILTQPYCITNIFSATPANGLPPTVQITAPVFGSQYAYPANISLTAVASAASNATLASISFYAATPSGNVQIAQVGASSGQSNLIASATWTPTAVGAYSLYAVAVDHSGLMGISTNVGVQVVNPYAGFTNAPGNPASPNAPPIARDDQLMVEGVVSNSVTYPINVLANDNSPNGYSLTLSSFIYTGRLGVVKQDGNRLLFTPNPLIEGTNYIYYTVSDGHGGTASAYVQVVVKMAALPSIQLVTPNDGDYIELPTVLSNRNLALVVYAQGSQNSIATNSVARVSFYDQDQLIGYTTTGVSNIYSFIWQTPPAGPHYLGAVVLDNIGQENITPYINIEVAGKANNNPPVATITNLSVTTQKLGQSFSYIYPQITNGIINVLGNAYDVDAGDVVSYQLLLQKPDGTLVANITPGADPVSGYLSGTDQAGVLASNVDLSIYQNGVYDVVLNVFDGWVVSSDSARILLNTQLKIGQFSFSVQDVALPVSGIPLTVTRTYNSFNLNNGEFGYSWTYAMNDINLQLDEVRQDTPDIDGNTFNLRVGGGRDVTLTLPDGRTETFQFYFDLSHPQAGGFCYAAWKSAPGVSYTLTAIGNPYYASLTGFWNNEGGTGFESYDFSGYILTAHDGTQYIIQRDDMGDYFYASGDNGTYSANDAYVHTYGAAHLTKIIQPNGDVIQINSDKIDHYNPAGALTRSVRFDRDGQNRIVAVRDPNSGSNGLPVMRYVYDGTGNLVNALRLTSTNGSGSYDTVTYEYTNSHFPHFMTGIVDPRGVGVAKNFYDDSGRLIGVQDANGNLTQFVHNTTNSMDIIVDRLGHTNTYVYDLRGNVTAQTNAAGEVKTMAYDTNNNKTNEISYFNGQPYATNSYQFDNNNLLLASSDPLGNINSFVYDIFGRLLVSTDARGSSTTNTYDSGGNLLSTTDALGNSTYNSYNNGLLTSSTDAIGNVTSSYYDDAENQVASATMDASGNILSTNSATFDNNGNRQTSTVWRQVAGVWTPATTTYYYDELNRVVQTVDPDGGTNTVVYNSLGKQASTIDKLGRTTSYTYDGPGRLVQTTYPDLTTESSVYDAAGNRSSSVDRAGRVTTYTYDALNRLVQTLYPDQTTSATVYDNLGRVAQSVDARGTITGFTYDAAGRRLAVTNAVGTTVQTVSTYTYDANGNQITFTDANQHTTTNVFDVLNRQVQVFAADGTQTATGYDAAGRRVLALNQDQITTLFGYDGAGRLTSVTNALGTSSQTVTRYQYDEAGNQVAQIDALNHVNTYTYDNLGRRIAHALPGAQSEGFAYDLGGNLLYTTNYNGVIITNQYDVMNRLTNQSSVNGYKVGYVNNPATGQRVTMTDASGTTTYSYDNRDRLLLKTLNRINGQAISLNYLYDANGMVTNIWSSSTNGVNLVYSYDPLNRLTNVLAGGTTVATYQFDAVGNLNALKYGNGVTSQYQYDTLNRLTNLTANTVSGTIASFYYQLGLTGNRTSLSETVNGTSRTYGWQYDSLYRMTNETMSALGTVAYAYDSVGNRTNRASSVSGLSNQTSTYNANDWLGSDKYDNNGSTTNSGGNVYQYDVMNRLTNVNNTIFITYDGDGNRASKTIGSQTTWYLVDDRNPSGYAQVLEESQGATLSRVYNYGLALISQRQVTAGVVSYYGIDGHGSTRFLTSAAGAVTDTYSYDAYGNLIASSGNTSNNYLYCGQQWDVDLGMYYNRARYYKPDSGRFWTMDTYEGNNEDPLSLHKYLYCQGNPVDCSDPSGRAVYFVKRKLSISGGRAAYNLVDIGHGYLLFTLPNDPGTERDPLTHGYGALTTFSWHPNVWDYTDQQAGYLNPNRAPGRVWERHPDDTNPKSYKPYLITTDADQQAALLKAIRNWISREQVGYEKGGPQTDPNDSDNDIGKLAHVPAKDNGVYYSLMEQNCVWWATIMLMQNGITIPPNAANAISSYNGGVGAAGRVISGQRSAFTVNTISGLLESMYLPQCGYGVSVDVGL